MLLYHGMYNIAHFEINNSVPLYQNTAVGDAYDYKRLRKVCFESGGAYINDSLIDGEHIRGGAHVTIQEDSIFLNIVPENPEAGIVYGLTFFMGADERTMYVYAEKREGGGGGESGVHSFNGRRGSVVSASGDYNAGMVSYANDDSGLVADDVQSAIDELAYENENLSDDVEDIQTTLPGIQSDLAAAQTAIGALQTNVGALQVNVGSIGEDVENLQDDVTAMASAIASKPDNLVDLNDVNITTPVDGQVLKYNSASEKWENGAGGGGGASALNDLSDVTIANPSSGQGLLYDGTKWANANLPVPPTVPDELNDLSDVDINTPTSGQVLTFNGTEWGNANLPAPPTVPDELNDLSDVDINTPTNGQVLKFNGTDWVNANESGGGADLSKTIAPIESGTTASRKYLIGELFIDKDGYLGNVTLTINSGDTLTPGTNYARLLESEFLKPGIIYTAVHDGTKTYQALLNEISSYWSNLPPAIKFRCALYMNKYIYHRAYSYGATNDYVVTKFSSSGVSYEQLSVTTVYSHYRVKDESGTFHTYDTTVAAYDIYLILNY